MVASGERVSCVGVARDMAFSIHGTPFHADLYVMPLAGFDMVLGRSTPTSMSCPSPASTWSWGLSGW